MSNALLVVEFVICVVAAVVAVAFAETQGWGVYRAIALAVGVTLVCVTAIEVAAR